jgi:putative transposase
MNNQETKYKNKYRISSTRLQSWDYSANGYYFITICTKDRQNFFGKIENETVILNESGKTAERFWLEIPQHFMNIRLDEYVIMPNHVHGILIIDNGMEIGSTPPVETRQCLVSTNVAHNELTKNGDNNNPGKKRFQNQGKNTISSIIGSYKSICTKTINKIQNDVFFGWQERFHDQIIRDENDLNNIREYIMYNPVKWETDEYYD